MILASKIGGAGIKNPNRTKKIKITIAE